VDNLGNGAIQEFLTFSLAGESYAINVANIKEVLGVPRITRVPRMPDYMSGVINLRGNVIPVLDLRLKFALGATPITEDTGIIVTEVSAGAAGDDSGLLTIGIFSDEVHKVETIEPSAIQPPPKIGMAIDTSFITGMGQTSDGFVIILNIDKLISAEELTGDRAEEGGENE
jgi:purine-binding chemotaxis protein CheW